MMEFPRHWMGIFQMFASNAKICPKKCHPQVSLHELHEPKKATDNPPEKFGSHWKSVNAIFLFCIPSLKTFSSLAILVWLALFWNLNNNFTRGKFCYWWIGWIPSRKNIQKKLSNQSMETSPMLEGLWLKRSDKVYLEKKH